MGVTDTSATVQAAQTAMYRRMTGEQRLLLAWDMSLFARELMKAGIRRDHPEWSERQVQREVWRLAFYPQPLPPGLP